jgi:hypothetical protein
MADIFLSYARQDEARAAAMARVLGELGWTVFWDRRIVAGSSWDEVVEREIGQCKCVVVLWSAAAVASRWVRIEANFGFRRGTLVPATLDRAEPPLEFSLIESAQLHAWTGETEHDEFSVLIDGISRHVQPQPRRSEPPSAAAAKPPTIRPRPRRRDSSRRRA